MRRLILFRHGKAEAASPTGQDIDRHLAARGVREANPRLTIFLEFAPPMLGHFQPPAEFLQQIRSEGFTVSTVDAVTGAVRPAADSQVLAAPWTELLLTRGV